MRFSSASRALVSAACLLLAGLVARLGAADAPAAPPADGGKPTLFLVGDSTVKNGTKGLKGWGEVIDAYLDPAKVTLVNAAIGGRSSRSFLTEGRWDQVAGRLKPGDVVLIQFGHNDGGDPQLDPAKRGTGRGSLRGTGEETREVTDPATGKKETVHTFGWYLRTYVRGAKAKGATPVVCSLIPRNDWKDGKVLRATTSYGGYAREVAKAEGVAFVDLNEIAARRYEQLGQEAVKPFFPQEHTHTDAAGADLNARCVVAGVRGLKGCPLAGWLSPAGAAIEPSDAVADAGPPGK